MEFALDVDLVALFFEYPVRERGIGRDVFVDGHPQVAEYDGDEAAGAGAADYVEVVAGLGRRVRVDSGHELTEDHELRQAAHAAAVEGEQADVVARHCGMFLGRFDDWAAVGMEFWSR